MLDDFFIIIFFLNLEDVSLYKSDMTIASMVIGNICVLEKKTVMRLLGEHISRKNKNVRNDKCFLMIAKFGVNFWNLVCACLSNIGLILHNVLGLDTWILHAMLILLPGKVE